MKIQSFENPTRRCAVTKVKTNTFKVCISKIPQACSMLGIRGYLRVLRSSRHMRNHAVKSRDCHRLKSAPNVGFSPTGSRNVRTCLNMSSNYQTSRWVQGNRRESLTSSY